MTATVTAIWRHPIKSHGREALEAVTVTPGNTMPGDRVWAVAHETANADNAEWAPCANFSRGAKAPALMAIDARYDIDAGTVTLTHPNRPEITLNPDTEADRLIDWSRSLIPTDRAASARIVRVPGRGMTDTDFPSISIGNMATHRAISQKLGRDLSPKRWRINLWLDGLAPWEEFDWIGKEINLGGARFAIREPITRCMATTASPRTGQRDADTLGILQTWGHQDMGVYAEVISGGTISLSNTMKVLP